jgi:hypothetical protein
MASTRVSFVSTKHISSAVFFRRGKIEIRKVCYSYFLRKKIIFFNN